MTQAQQEGIVIRFQFLPDRAAEFSETGTEIVEMLFDSLAEAEPFIHEFHDAMVDAVALVNGQVIPVRKTDESV